MKAQIWNYGNYVLKGHDRGLKRITDKSDIIEQHLKERALRSRLASRKSLERDRQQKIKAQEKAEAADRVPQWFIDIVEKSAKG